jgi:2-methylisocitrate lyase-like PEP mutase family enzyme
MSVSSFDQFVKLHQQAEPLLIGNVWSAQSARVLEKLRLQALATSSSAVAETLGYADGEVMSFEEYLFVVKRISASTNLPLSVDLEAGYGKSVDEIVANIAKLHSLGIVGINIEDSIIEGGTRKLVSAETFTEKLRLISEALHSQHINLFVNVRCDAYLLGVANARQEGIRRMKLYEAQGVHGMFLPCITNLDDIKESVKSTRLPVNVMCMPNLPDFSALKAAGVKRISMGNSLNQAAYQAMEKKIQQIIVDQNFSALF